MKRQRRTFTPEFKLQLVKLYENGKPRAEIPENTILHLLRSIAGLKTIKKRVHSLRRIIERKKKMKWLDYVRKTNVY